jgi:hypothetical protein
VPTRSTQRYGKIARQCVGNSTFDSFLRKWREGLGSPTGLWEGNFAIEELRVTPYTEKRSVAATKPENTTRASMLKFVRCEPGQGPRPREMLERVLDEVEDYKDRKLRWRNQQDQRDLRSTELLLAQIERKVVRQNARVADGKLKQLLSEAAHVIDHSRAGIGKLRDPRRPSPLGPWELLWKGQPRMENLRRQLDLDAQLQIQAAKMFRIFLREDQGISLRTICPSRCTGISD